MELIDVLTAIRDGAFDADLDTIRDACIERRNSVHRTLAQTVHAGDRVMLTNIRPVSLNGATGEVTGRRNTRVLVRIDREFGYKAGRFAGMIEAGSPLAVHESCIGEVLR